MQTAVEKYLKPFLIGRDVDQIEDIWQSSYVSSYWRNGPVLFNAMSGVDMALWDIKGKRANMPVYQLLGGKCRFAAAVYAHVSGSDIKQVEDNAAPRWPRATGISACRWRSPAWRPTGTAAPTSRRTPRGRSGRPIPRRSGSPAPYLRARSRNCSSTCAPTLGDDIELLHDVHERITPSQAVSLCKELEKYHLFFLEDPLPPEEKDHFRLIRQQSSVPLAMGELFNTQQEYVPLIAERLIDFIRIHISQIGGLSMARKVAALCEFFGVKTAWHGPGDASRSATPPGWPSSWPRTTSASTRATSSRPRPARSSPAAPRQRTATCTPTRPPDWESTSTRSWPPSIQSPTPPPSTSDGVRPARRDGTVIRP